VAALIPEARAARVEANRLRRESRELRFSLRRSAARSRERLEAAEAAMNRVQARRQEALPSPWSTLCWSYDDATVARVLVSIPS